MNFITKLFSSDHSIVCDLLISNGWSRDGDNVLSKKYGDTLSKKYCDEFTTTIRLTASGIEIQIRKYDHSNNPTIEYANLNSESKIVVFERDLELAVEERRKKIKNSKEMRVSALREIIKETKSKK